MGKFPSLPAFSFSFFALENIFGLETFYHSRKNYLHFTSARSFTLEGIFCVLCSVPFSLLKLIISHSIIYFYLICCISFLLILQLFFIFGLNYYVLIALRLVTGYVNYDLFIYNFITVEFPFCFYTCSIISFVL